jgi:hypothetical protein
MFKDIDRKTMIRMWSKHRKLIIGSVVAFAFFATLMVGGIVWGSYAAWKQLTQSQAWGHNKGFVSEVVLNLTGHSLADSFESGDLRAVLDGMACVNAMGGPGPEALMAHLKNRFYDPQTTSRLTELEQLIKAGVKTRPQGSCLNWLISG